MDFCPVQTLVSVPVPLSFRDFGFLASAVAMKARKRLSQRPYLGNQIGASHLSLDEVNINLSYKIVWAPKSYKG